MTWRNGVPHSGSWWFHGKDGFSIRWDAESLPIPGHPPVSLGTLVHEMNLADRHRAARRSNPWERWMARIDHYEFGRISIDGREETKDLIVLPDQVVRN